MSDSSDNYKRSTVEPILLYDEAVRFLIVKTPNGKCFACGTDMWNISTKEESTDHCFLRKAGGTISGAPAYNLELECNNCGLIRTHRSEVMLAWLAMNPKTDDASRAPENE